MKILTNKEYKELKEKQIILDRDYNYENFNREIRNKIAEMEFKNLDVVVLSGEVYGRKFKMIIENYD